MPAWIQPIDRTAPAALREAVGGHPMLSAILARRGFIHPQQALAFLNPQHYTPASAEDFPGMDKACSRIEKALQQNQRIWIWGDFDVDGQTSTALLVSLLQNLGGNPRYHIPVRARESHGINIPNLERIIAEGCDLLITCDTGITAHDALIYAQQQGVDVIVTDHHVIGETLPPALAHITPRLLPHEHPLSTLPGVGVAYKLAEAMFARSGQPLAAGELLDLVALGIVADVALQVHDTRYLLQLGLKELRSTRRTGLQAIFKAADVNPSFLTEEHLGFAIAPRLNALGRLDDANPAVELFTTADSDRARALALQLETLNARRQLLTSQVVQAAEKQLERHPELLNAPAIVLSHPDWPAGILGIAASALVERYHKPTLLITNPAGRPAGGSARSVEGVDITSCIASQKQILRGYGGHPMAAGLSLDSENIAVFRRGLIRAVENALAASGGPLEPTIQIEGDLRINQLSMDLIADLERLSPFGPGNPPLVFAIRDVSLASSARIGRGKDHLQLTIEDMNGRTQKVIWWGGARNRLPDGRFDLACVLRASDFRGQQEVQVEVVDLKKLESVTLDAGATQRELIDHRTETYPRQVLDRIRQQSEVVVWAEGEDRDHVDGLDRTHLKLGKTLVVWTIPPGRMELQAALEAVAPQRIIFFAQLPETRDAAPFLARLTGLVKFSLRSYSNSPIAAELPRLAGATAQSESAVRIGLSYLHARGLLELGKDSQGELFYSPGSGQERGSAKEILHRLTAVLKETAAYRAYYQATNIESIDL